MAIEGITKGWERRVVFHLNGKETAVSDADPNTPLLTYLRDVAGLTGTKLVCGEGACGACTVMLSRFDEARGRVAHRAVNACLYPLCACDGCAVTTIEALGESGRLHAIQARFAHGYGSQCGFCTPGFVMALYAFLSERPAASAAEIEAALDGNLCRCTGYRPILGAARALAGTQDGMRLGALTPDETLRAARKSVAVGDARGRMWFTPRCLDDVVALKAALPDARIIAGNSEVGVDARLKGVRPAHLIHAAHVPELVRVQLTDDGLVIGAGVALSDLDEFIRDATAALPEERCRGFAAVRKQLLYFACRQIRNVACVGGNLTTASPTSDLNPVFLAMDAAITVRSAARGTRVLHASKWFVGYRRVALEPDEVVVSITVPYTRPGEFVEAFKVSRRKEDDIHVACACFRVLLEKAAAKTSPSPATAAAAAATTETHYTNPILHPTSVASAETVTSAKDEFAPPALEQLPLGEHEAFAVKEMRLAFGSMAVKTSLSPSAAQAAIGKLWTSDIFAGVFAGVEKDLPLAPKTPGGMVEYRRTMVKSLFFKFFLRVCNAVYGPESIPELYKTALAEPPHRPMTQATQVADERPQTDTCCVGASVDHISAERQTTGEAKFVDDTPVARNELFGSLIMSSKAHARVLRIDTSKAKAHPGVTAVYTAEDIPGENNVGEGLSSEEIFATKEVYCVGYPLGIVVAETREAAREAAALVVVEYEELKPLLTIQDAVAAESWLSPNFEIHRGNVDEAFAAAEYKIEGEVVIEGQDHMYLETQGAIATPGECGEMNLLSSTQNPTMTQLCVAKCLGVDANRVTARVRRVGGGFGGKETRSVPVACAAAIAAHCSKRPVRLVLDRDVDFQIHGLRHPYLARYRAGFTKEGKIVAFDTQLFANGGHSLDLSVAVLHRALFHVDNAYYVPNIRCRGRVCKTHRPSNTAYRGFGGPQGMMAIETTVQRIADALKIDPAAVRALNLYREGEKTHYNKVLENCNLERVWTELMQSSDYERRRAAAAEFNRHSRFVKRGVAAVPVKFGLSFTHAPLNQAGALVHVYQDGTVLVSQGAVELGQGVFTKMAQVAATELRIPLELVRVGDTRTDMVANTSATAASVQADLNGMAVMRACKQIRDRLDTFIATNPSELQKLKWPELVVRAYNARVDLSAHGHFEALYGFDFKTQTGKVFAYFTFGAAVTEVEVDVLTGEHRLLRSDVVMDLGKSLNPALDVGQVEGAFLQGVGWSTIEQLVVFENGSMYTRGPGTYKIPGPGDVPLEFHVSLLRGSCNPFAIHSSKGVGEPPFFLGTSAYFAIKEAVASARADAHIDGYFQMSLPSTVERVRMACRDAFTDPPGLSGLPGCFIEEFPVTRDVLKPKKH